MSRSGAAPGGRRNVELLEYYCMLVRTQNMAAALPTVRKPSITGIAKLRNGLLAQMLNVRRLSYSDRADSPELPSCRADTNISARPSYFVSLKIRASWPILPYLVIRS